MALVVQYNRASRRKQMQWCSRFLVQIENKPLSRPPPSLQNPSHPFLPTPPPTAFGGLKCVFFWDHKVNELNIYTHTDGSLWIVSCSKSCTGRLGAGIQVFGACSGGSFDEYSDGELYCSTNGVVGTHWMSTSVETAPPSLMVFRLSGTCLVEDHQINRKCVI